MEAKPFTVTTSVNVRGGFTDKKIDMDTEIVDNMMFFAIKAFKDFKLLAAFGLAKPVKSASGKTQKYEYTKCKVFDYLKELRFKAVTLLLSAAIAGDDPFAEDQPAGQDCEVAKRQELFLKYDIPQVCVATCKEFTLMGQTIPPFEMTMLTTATKNGLLKLECTGSVLDWLCKAIQADPESWFVAAPVARKRKLEELPDLPSHIRYAHSKHNKVMIYSRFKNSQGKWCKHEKVIEDVLDRLGGEEASDAAYIATLCDSLDRELEEKKSKDKEVLAKSSDDLADDDER